MLRLLNEGYALAQNISTEYETRRTQQEFDRDRDVPNFRKRVNDWVNTTARTLQELFPTQLESNFFSRRFSVSAADYLSIDNAVGELVFERLPTYLDRLHRILDTYVVRYGDLPLAERLFVEDVDSFAKVRDVNPNLVAPLLSNGRIELSENEVQLSLEAILDVPFHKNDWGGETDDLYTANLVLNGRRRATAFLLKGNGLKAPQLQIAHCGRNGDQILRLFQSPAQVFVIQFVGPISEAVVDDVLQKTVLRRSRGSEANFLIIDGQDTARLLFAYGKLTTPVISHERTAADEMLAHAGAGVMKAAKKKAGMAAKARKNRVAGGSVKRVVTRSGSRRRHARTRR